MSGVASTLRGSHVRQSTVALLAVLACTIFAAWFFTTHEKVTRDEFTGYRGEARFNNFLAADMLLNELGVAAESRSSLTPTEWLPFDTDTIVSRVSSNIAVGEQRDLLVRWIIDGGHLILMPPLQESRIFDDFLGYLGFGLVRLEPDPDDNDNDNDDDNDDDESPAGTEPENLTYALDPDRSFYRIELHEDHEFGATFSDQKGVLAARQVWGSGYVTLLASSAYFSNRSIDEPDHARFMMDVIAGHVDPGKVWLIYDATFPALWRVIWDNAPYVVVSLVIAVVLWLWSIMPAFGPPITLDPPVRRSIIEHVGAAGRFVWRNHGAVALAKSSAAAVMHEAEARHPGIGRLSAQEQAKRIARMTGLSAQAILDVLVNQGEPRQREFTHNMQALQRMRKEL